jgi:hypothetical protein
LAADILDVRNRIAIAVKNIHPEFKNEDNKEHLKNHPIRVYPVINKMHKKWYNRCWVMKGDQNV